MLPLVFDLNLILRIFKANIRLGEYSNILVYCSQYSRCYNIAAVEGCHVSKTHRWWNLLNQKVFFWEHESGIYVQLNHNILQTIKMVGCCLASWEAAYRTLVEEFILVYCKIGILLYRSSTFVHPKKGPFSVAFFI